MKDVYICEMEVISPLGVGLEAHFENTVNGMSGAGPISAFDASALPVNIGCEVKADLAHMYADTEFAVREALGNDRKTELFYACTALLEDRLRPLTEQVQKEDIGIFLGIGMEGVPTKQVVDTFALEESPAMSQIYQANQSHHLFNPYLNPVESCEHHLSRLTGARGKTEIIRTACSAGAQAIGQAARHIAAGRCQLAITGGADSRINLFSMAAFIILDMISKRVDEPAQASRPFDADRDGFVTGEGAALLVLANRETVDRLGLDPIAQIAGYGSSLDAYKLTTPHETGYGAFLAMERVLEDAGWSPSEVTYLNAHGTATVLNDKRESEAIRKLFGDSTADLLVSSSKSQTGHLIAAAGAVELVTTAMAVKTGYVPPSINIDTPDPSLGLNIQQARRFKRPVKKAISNSFALAGVNASLAIEAVRA